MNNRNIKLIPLVFFLFAYSCESDKEPTIENVLQYSFRFINEPAKRLIAGEIYPDTIKFTFNSRQPKPSDRVNVIFTAVDGSKSAEIDSAELSAADTAFTMWTLGTGSFRQVLTASAYDIAGRFLTSASLTAYGFRPGEWDSFSEYPERFISSMASDTANDVTLMTASGNLYKQGERYFDWEYIALPGIRSVKSVKIDSDGVYYLNTWEGNIHRSTDHGQTWISCTKPYPGDSHSFLMSVSNDGMIWAFKDDSAAKFSADRCLTWQRAAKGLPAFGGYADIFRLSDGTLLFHGANCCGLQKSVDNGLTWNRLETPGLSDKLYVTDDDRIFIILQKDGVSIYKSDDKGATFNRVINFYPAFWTSYKNNIFNKYGDKYYVLVQGYGIAKSSDLINYQVIYENHNLADLFIDYQGNMIATDLSNNNACYWKNPNK